MIENNTINIKALSRSARKAEISSSAASGSTGAALSVDDITTESLVISEISVSEAMPVVSEYSSVEDKHMNNNMSNDMADRLYLNLVDNSNRTSIDNEIIPKVNREVAGRNPEKYG
jgi:hypothetical protein